MILDAPSVICKGYERHYLPGTMFGPYSFRSICDGREEVDSVGESRKNMVEVAVIVKIVQDLFKAWEGSREKLTIGIISPYAAQVATVQEKIGRKYEKLKNFSLRVMLVEGEEDIVIISTVRSDSGGSIGSLSNPKHCNVALTRARHCLWIMGNDKTLSNSGSCWEMIVQDAKDRNCFFYAHEDKEIAKVLLEAKKELGQLDDLLNGDSVLFKSARWKVYLVINLGGHLGN
ncbi:helicase SEN1-like isoform X2 [Papaver somniferum]|uniref:helicase SEN1-like isoform X2 n=1 Tax=Papaver somniferum TaxID=3469 RepID=UPI000E6FA655|nr:helicase SEN1-like isoform X2 [Papaver somniferum]